MKKLGLFIFLLLLGFTACREDIDDVSIDEIPYVPPVIQQWEQGILNVQGSVTGFVTDENGEPVTGADVNLGNLNTTTDAFGHFFFKNTTLNSKGTLVRVEKQGFFPGSRRFFAIEGMENRVRIELITKNFDYSFNAQSGGSVVMNGGAKVTFTPNSIRTSDGTPYTGTVHVAAKWLDPEDLRTLDRMPGNLQGVDNEAREVALSTAGMMAVELESETGEPLNIREGYTAEISMPVPAGLIGKAPAEVPNWSYVESVGMWAEEGVSALQGNHYVGEVSHFSFWNHDFKDPLIEFKATFQDENDNPLENYKVVVRQPGTGLAGYGYTDDGGMILGLIPKDYTLLLEVFNQCGGSSGVIYSQNIGPYSNDVDLGVITVSNTGLNPTTLQGELVDCNGDPVENGLVIFEFDGVTIYEYTDGDPFEVTLSTCNTTTNIDVKGVDLDDLLESDPVSAPAGGTTDLGQISVCAQQIQNYIRINVDGVEALYTPASVFQDSSNLTTISFFGNNQQSQIYIFFNGQTAGNYDDPENFVEIIFDQANNWALGGNPTGGAGFDNFEVTEYGNSGEPVKGNFSGMLLNRAVQPPVQVNVSGEFNIIRN